MLSFVSTAQVRVCPDGFEQRDVTLTYPIPGYGDCEIYVIYCCKWDEEDSVVTFFPAGFESDCLANIQDIEGWQDFFDWFDEQLTYEAYYYCSPIPPCPHTTIISDFSRADCWYFENKLVPAPGEDVYRLRLIPCEYYNLCENFYSACFDLNYTPPLLVREFMFSRQSGDNDCPTDIPELPPNGKTWDEYWITRCFAIPCR